MLNRSYFSSVGKREKAKFNLARINFDLANLDFDLVESKFQSAIINPNTARQCFWRANTNPTAARSNFPVASMDCEPVITIPKDNQQISRGCYNFGWPLLTWSIHFSIF